MEMFNGQMDKFYLEDSILYNNNMDKCKETLNKTMDIMVLNGVWMELNLDNFIMIRVWMDIYLDNYNMIKIIQNKKMKKMK